MVRQHQDDETWCRNRLVNDIDPCAISTPTSCQDLYIAVRQAFRTNCGTTGYNPVADVNKDDVVNTLDISQIARNITDNTWCSQRLADNSSSCIVDSTIENPEGNFVQQIIQNFTNILR